MMFFLALSIGLAEPECEVARNMKALEFFLQDESDHNEFCPKLKYIPWSKQFRYATKEHFTFFRRPFTFWNEND